MRLTDYIAEFIYNQGIDTVFGVTGGGSVFLTDGIAAHSKLCLISNHHEQASAMAAVAYAKYHGIGCAYLTTGCGGTNAITGLLHAWQDSTACIFISGQTSLKYTIKNSGIPIRQFGLQEADIVPIVTSITKYAVMVDGPEDIRYHLEKAVWLAKNGRPGPVWLDIPYDIQTASIDPDVLRPFEPEEILSAKINYDMIINSLKKAKRPLIVAGQGVRLSGRTKQFKDFVHQHKIPVVCSRLGVDVIPYSDPFYLGCIGNRGTRPGNFAVQNADLVLSIGSRLSIQSTGYSYENFAPKAKLIVVDIDPLEHKKNTVKIDDFINCNITDFFDNMPDFVYLSPDEWQQRTALWKKKYPAYDPRFPGSKKRIDLYLFMHILSICMHEDDVVVTDAGSAVFAGSSGIELHSENQRYITSGAQAEMGFTLPATIGVCKAAKHRVIGITGDGSLQMNIQELQTVIHHQFPVKLFVWNNDGYLSIRTTQNKTMPDARTIGTDRSNGVSFPDLSKIACAYGIEYVQIQEPKELEAKIKQVLSFDGPVFCEVLCDPDQEIIPSVVAQKTADGKNVWPLDDMYPFLDRDEYKSNMLE
jgi:acetolactate synthase-1/2/3 large subunit